MKPILKWAGSKRRFVDTLKERINLNETNTFFELFAGSAAISFELNHNKIIINDLNIELINFYEILKKFPFELSEKINENSSIEYYKLRNDFNNLISGKKNDKKTLITKAAFFFLINKYSFNGIYRVNSFGKFNVPKGSSRKYEVKLNPNEAEQYSKFLKKISIFCKDYTSFLDKIKKNDVIYLDPPYYPDKSSKFIGYTDPAFGKEQHKELINFSFAAFKKGAKILISNSDSEEFATLINEKFKKPIFFETLEIKRTINPKSLNIDKFKERLYIINNGEI